MSSIKSDETESPHTPQKDDDEEWVYVPPDGGWGWLILSGTLLINMLIPGTIKSFGVLFVEFIEVFQTTPLVASWIPALCYFLYCSTGPLTTYLSIKTSYRTVTIAGGLFAAFGMVLSSFATSIVYLYVSFGVMVGLGAGLSFPPGIYLVTSYFVRYRGVANGLAISGSAIGSIIFPPFLRFLLETYGYRGAVLIMGGLTFNVMVGALLYDPVEMHLKRVRVKKDTSNGGGLELNSSPTTSPVIDNDNKLSDVIIGSATAKNNGPESEQPLLSSPTMEDSIRKISVGSNVKRSNLGDGAVVRKISSSSYSGRMNNVGSQQMLRKISPSSKSPQRLGASMGQMPRNYSVASNMSNSSLRYVSTAFHGSTLASMGNIHDQFSSSMAMRKGEKSGCLCFGCCKSSGQPKKKEDSTLKKWARLFENPLFVVILISNATNAIGYTNFTILTPAYAIDLGYDKSKASYLLSIIATTDLIGRIGGASLSDFLKLDKRFYFIGGFLFSGIALTILPIFTDYKAMAACCALFGLASGSYVGITTVIMVELLGEKQLADSYGISLLVNGILQLIGPPICGAVYQRIQSYRIIVSGLGIILVFGAAVWLVTPFFKKPGKK